MAENFFSILKAECIYWYKPATFSEPNDMIDRYIHFHKHERIQIETGRSCCATPAKTQYFCTRGLFCTVCTIWGSKFAEVTPKN
ncbi:IS3 family transposase [Massilioclostridium coli]|uniref:IS3 family transposase n=1 Tax=Massilioclostridium coli TaxID=1870991 RepID=UPI003A5991AD